MVFERDSVSCARQLAIETNAARSDRQRVATAVTVHYKRRLRCFRRLTNLPNMPSIARQPISRENSCDQAVILKARRVQLTKTTIILLTAGVANDDTKEQETMVSGRASDLDDLRLTSVAHGHSRIDRSKRLPNN